MKRPFYLRAIPLAVAGLIFLASGAMSAAFADETTIIADTLEYIKEEQKYIATGNVKILKGDAVIKADSAIYFDDTADSELTGHVTIEDKDCTIITEQARFNLSDKTGSLHNAVIHFKKDNYWIRGFNMQKLGDNHYYAKTAFFTPCDSEAYRTSKVLESGDIPASQRPDWCFKGDDADILVGDRMTAKNATYRIKDIPVLYWPYFWAPAGGRRESGFLTPLVGNSSTKGVRFSPSYFWVIDENKDATFTADYYSKRGLGTGAEYRFLDFDHKGTWYAYHLRDGKLHTDFVEVKANDKYTAGNMQAFLDLNYINHLTFYKEYPKDFQANISRFLQSSAEASLPLGNSRLYFLNQYWINLREGVTEHVPQKFPEFGYVVNPTAAGPAVFTLSASAANFFRSDEPHGQRIDIQPALSYSFGDSIRLTQKISLGETAYNLTDGGSYGSSPHREIFQYNAQVQTRFLKNYGPFLHVVEPSIEYVFIPTAKSLPLFDSTELPVKSSIAQLSLYNKFMFEGLDVSLRISQPYNFDGQSNIASNPLFDISNSVAGPVHSLLPTRLDGSVSGAALPVNLNFNVAYDFINGAVNTFNSSVSFKIFRDIVLSLGEHYSKIDNLMALAVGINAPLGRKWLVIANTSYDAKGPGLRDFNIKTTYKEQCWNVAIAATRRPADQFRPADYSYTVMLELRGIGSLKL